MLILFLIYQEITKNDGAYEKRKEKRSTSLITKKKHTLGIYNNYYDVDGNMESKHS